jgi:hypothetical protein
LPLQHQLGARNEALERIRHEKAELEAALAAARREVEAANARAQGASAQSGADAAATGAMSAPTEPPVTSHPPLFGGLRSRLIPRPSWLWTGVAALVALGIGFGLGWRVLDRRIRAKYGGLRIY